MRVGKIAEATELFERAEAAIPDVILEGTRVVLVVPAQAVIGPAQELINAVSTTTEAVRDLLWGAGMIPFDESEAAFEVLNAADAAFQRAARQLIHS
jgi:hypothetical protein